MAGNSKSPAELKSEGEELKALFAKVKKKPHNCAVLMAKDGVVIEAHIKKSPDILVKAGKKNGGMAKGAWGIMTMDGQVIRIDPVNDKVPGNLTKLAKKHFSARGLKFRLEILEAEEESQEEAAAEEQDAGQSTASGEDGGEAEETGDQKQELETRLAEMQDKIDALLADTENVMFSALQDGLSAHNRAMDGEDFERGTSTLDSLDGVLEDYAGILEKKEPLQARIDAMAADIERVKKGENAEAADQVGKFGREFDYALANNEWGGAETNLKAIEDLLAEHGGNSGAEEEEEEEIQASSSSDSQESDSETTDTPQEEEEDLSNVPSNSDKLRRANMKAQLDGHKKAIGAILKNKDSENGKAITASLLSYTKGLKGGDLDAAQAGIDETEAVLEKAEREFSLTEKQRSAIMKELEKMTAEIASLTAELAE